MAGVENTRDTDSSCPAFLCRLPVGPFDIGVSATGGGAACLTGMEEKLYPNLATFLVRLASLAMGVYGLWAVVYWWVIVPRIAGNDMGILLSSMSGFVENALATGGAWIVGAIALFALSRPLGKLVALGL